MRSMLQYGQIFEFMMMPCTYVQITFVLSYAVESLCFNYPLHSVIQGLKIHIKTNKTVLTYQEVENEKCTNFVKR